MHKKVLVTSTSALKLSAVSTFLGDFEKDNVLFTVNGFNCDALNLPKQPINNNGQGDCFSNVFKFAMARIKYASDNLDGFDKYDMVLSIENGLALNEHICPENIYDICYVVLMIPRSGLIATGTSHGKKTDILVPIKYFEKLESQQKLQRFAHGILGYDVTLGELLHQDDSTIDAKNWMLQIHNIDRKAQINMGLIGAFNHLSLKIEQIEILTSQIVMYDNYPKQGVKFQDIMPIIRNAFHLELLMSLIQDNYQLEDVDIIVGLESRGFLLGAPLAIYMKKGFVPIRKAGKLPGDVFQESYTKEYGRDVCEIQSSSITKGQRVLIVDDIIATGGSLKAAVNLVKKCGGIVVDCLVLQEVEPLRQKCKETLQRSYTILFST